MKGPPTSELNCNVNCGSQLQSSGCMRKMCLNPTLRVNFPGFMFMPM